MKPSPRIALLLVVAALMTACSGGAATTTAGSVATTSTTPATTTTAAPTTTLPPTTTIAPTTTTTQAAGPASPVNGLAVADEALIQRRAMAVKVDNHPNARPQSGLQQADMVIEILVEGGFTRFIALFLQSDSEYVGPVRSIRPTDSAILAGVGAPLAVSGGQAWIRDLAASRDVNLIREGAKGLFRISSRRAPHNLYANTIDLRATADSRDYPDTFGTPLFAVGRWQPPAATATNVTLKWTSGHTVNWTYQDGKYLRFEGDRPHNWVDREGNTGQLAFDTLVVIEVDESSAAPPAGVHGSSVPMAQTTGEGRVLVFAQGSMVEGTWERQELTDPFTLLDTAGNPITVPAGTQWVSLFPQGRGLTWS